MLELAHADVGRVAVAADADARELAVGQQAPVATDGIRPCSALKPWLYWRKYAGVLLEQPMPLNLPAVYGLTPTACTPRSGGW